MCSRSWCRSSTSSSYSSSWRSAVMFVVRIPILIFAFFFRYYFNVHDYFLGRIGEQTGEEPPAGAGGGSVGQNDLEGFDAGPAASLEEVRDSAEDGESEQNQRH